MLLVVLFSGDSGIGIVVVDVVEDGNDGVGGGSFRLLIMWLLWDVLMLLVLVFGDGSVVGVVFFGEVEDDGGGW